MPKYEEISLIEFINRFPDDDACREHLFKLRWPEGFRCPVCGHTEYTKHGSRELYICKSCGH
ncbi:MAG: transposase [Synergistes sp.]|nr:transposase [Synergistes sp.]